MVDLQGLCVYLQFNCNTLHHLHRARHLWRYLVTIKQEKEMNMCSCTIVITYCILILRFQKKSEPNKAKLHVATIVVRSNSCLSKSTTSSATNNGQQCPWILSTLNFLFKTNRWSVENETRMTCINSTKILVISCMTWIIYSFNK